MYNSWRANGTADIFQLIHIGFTVDFPILSTQWDGITWLTVLHSGWLVFVFCFFSSDFGVFNFLHFVLVLWKYKNVYITVVAWFINTIKPKTQFYNLFHTCLAVRYFLPWYLQLSECFCDYILKMLLCENSLLCIYLLPSLSCEFLRDYDWIQN